MKGVGGGAGRGRQTQEQQTQPGGLELLGLRKVYGPVVAVDYFHVSVERGILLSLLGPSGCGKTTTLHMIAGLVPASAGTIRIGGRDITSVPPHRRGVGMVFQDYALYPHRTVRDNIAFPLELAGVRRAEIAARVSEVLSRVQLQAQGNRLPRELSGGQQQRVALARALVKRPELLLFDEPLSNLDATLRAEMRELIRDLHLEFGATSVFVTHDQEEAMAISDVIAVMNGGRIVQVGSPREIYDRPASDFVARFVGRPAIRLHDGSLDGGVLTVGGTRMAEVGLPSGPVRAGVRPENVRVAFESSQRTHHRGDVLRVEHSGADDYAEVDLAGTALLARVSPAMNLNRGDQVYLGTDPRSWQIFDAQTGERVSEQSADTVPSTRQG